LTTIFQDYLRGKRTLKIAKTCGWLIFADMVYKVIGLMSGSSLDGLDLAYVHLQERAVTAAASVPRAWEYTLVQTACYPYPEEWKDRLATAPGLSARDYLLLHTAYGHFLGEQVLRFIEEHGLHYQVQLIASHGHTVFHVPDQRMTAQLGDGAALAAVTRINVVSDLRAMDLALGGQGAPIVPVGEGLLLGGNGYFLNLGGIANISAHGMWAAGGAASAIGAATAIGAANFSAFDVCPANRVLNALAALAGKPYDDGGELAAEGRVDEELLDRLNALPYYGMSYPKSLDNAFGTETVLPMVREAMGAAAGAVGGLSIADAMRTYVEHIAVQVVKAVKKLGVLSNVSETGAPQGARMLVTGGGAHNTFLVGQLREGLATLGIELVVPDAALVDYKEALVMALIGVLRWREENNILASVTGASRDSIGGAVWIGQEA
jgi:anhydro-N-acetylmuramic acid kinase